MALPDFPAISNLGEQSKFKEYGLRLDSHKEPQIRLVGNELDVDIKYKADEPVRTLAVLRSVPEQKEHEDCVFIQTDERKHIIQFKVIIPKCGFWKLELYALPASAQDTDKLIGVFNYVIHCNKIITKQYPYPKRYKQWSDGCFLYDPLILHKDVRGPSVHFKVRVPKANDVAVCVNNEQPWIHLQDETNDGLWEGNVKVGDHYGKNVNVTLNARYGSDKGSSYTTLLQYTI